MTISWLKWNSLGVAHEKGNVKTNHMAQTPEKMEIPSLSREDVAARFGTFEDGVTLELGDGFCREKDAVSKDMLLESKAAARTLKVGSRGEDVRQLQQNLNTLGYNAGKPDGIFGNGTKSEVIRFQKTYGLSADGIAGKNTLDAIATTVRRKNNGILSKGQVSAEVKSLQNNLKNLGYLNGPADGAFGSGTEAAVKAFQKAHGMTPDGLVGGGTKAQISKAIQEKEERESSVLKVGSRGDKVRTLQSSLNALGYNAGTPDGQFGSGTQNEVIRFQKTYGLTADGQAGPNTQQAIAKALNYKNNGVLAKGQFSNDVKSLQSDLKTLGYLNGSADGAFGSGTEAAVKAFQKAHNLTQDGLVGSGIRAEITAAVHAKEENEQSILKLGSKGAAVKTLQENLNALGYNTGTPDGQFGSETQKGVVRFQKTYGLFADGQVGPETRNAIEKALNYKNKKILSRGQVSDEVRNVQKNLITLGYLSKPDDGVFGKDTETAVRKFQTSIGDAVDGLVGVKLVEKLIKYVKEKLSKTEESEEPTSPTTKPEKPTTSNLPMLYDLVDYGKLSAKYESRGTCGTISTGKNDNGGKSYGLYQFASSSGIPYKFTEWLQSKNTDMYNALNDAYNLDGGYGASFDAAWKRIAENHEEQFSKLQYQYTKEIYYDPSVQKMKDNGFDVTQRGYTLNAVIWSRAVQNNGCAIIFDRATKDMGDLEKRSDEEIIKAIYAENSKLTNTPPKNTAIRITPEDKATYNIDGNYLFYFCSQPSSTQASVYKRLHETELNEALNYLSIYG